MKRLMWEEIPAEKPGDQLGHHAVCGPLIVSVTEWEKGAWEVVITDHVSDFMKGQVLSTDLEVVKDEAMKMLRGVFQELISKVDEVLGPKKGSDELRFINICSMPGDPGHYGPSIRGLAQDGRVYAQWNSDSPWVPCNMKKMPKP